LTRDVKDEHPDEEVKDGDLNMMIYEDIASPRIFKKDSRKKDRNRSPSDSRDRDEIRRKKRADEEKHTTPTGVTMTTIPVNPGIPTMPAMYRPPYGYFNPYAYGGTPMVQSMYGYPPGAMNPMMVRPGMTMAG
jgi:hypothetical protein